MLHCGRVALGGCSGGAERELADAGWLNAAQRGGCFPYGVESVYHNDLARVWWEALSKQKSATLSSASCQGLGNKVSTSEKADDVGFRDESFR